MVVGEVTPVRPPPPHCAGYQPRASPPHPQKKGLVFRRVERKLRSHDPRRLAILARLRLIWRHLPRNGVLVFFDEQPIAVKAYGGRRYTSAKRLLLDRLQKTRGFFYLFVIYDVNTGRRRWAFSTGKSSKYICRFLEQIRRWYPHQQVWIALDHDPAHPCTSRYTRRRMRPLQLHWITLPKGSPDDNPVETIFSDIQLMVLDNSNDPDMQTTQRRIRWHLQRCNRRHHRNIRIAYLPDSHKQ
jgi:transposase